jgi:hypothetical protein
VLVGAAIALTTGCPQKQPQEKVLRVEPRAEIVADRDALVVTGQGTAPAGKSTGQGRLMAQRAAKMDALVQLATAVGDFQMKSSGNGARLDVKGFVQGAREVETAYDSTNGLARVTLELPLNGVGGVAGALGFDRILIVSATETQKKP